MLGGNTATTTAAPAGGGLGGGLGGGGGGLGGLGTGGGVAGTGPGVAPLGGTRPAAPLSSAPAGGMGTYGRTGGGGCWNFFLYVLAIVLPPVAVFFKVALGSSFWINVLLTILGWIPGVLHAWYVIATRPRRTMVY